MNYDYKYRLYPTPEQEEALEFTRNTCRSLYNHYLEDFKENGVYMSKYQAQSDLTSLKAGWSELSSVHSRVLQMVVHRLFNNLESVTPHFQPSYNVDRLRYKGDNWYKTFTYHQSGFDLQVEDTWLDSLYLSKIGNVPIKYHRSLPDNADIKQVKVKKETNGDWYAILGIEVDDEIESTIQDDESAVSVGLGIDTFSVDSDGVGSIQPSVDDTTRKIQRKKQNLSRKTKGSNNYEAEREKLGELQNYIQRKQRDFLHKLSRYYINNYDIVIVESRYIGRSNASWWEFVKMLKYKAESAGTLIKEIPHEEDQRYTCDTCGTSSLDKEWLKHQECPACGNEATRDASHLRRVFHEGAQNLGLGQAEVKPVDIIATTEDLESSLGGMDEAGNSLTVQENRSLP